MKFSVAIAKLNHILGCKVMSKKHTFLTNFNFLDLPTAMLWFNKY